MKYSVFIFVFFSYLFIGCSKSSQSTEIQHGSDIDGKNVICTPNQVFTLTMDVHFDGGYQWFHTISDTDVVQLDSTNYQSKSSQQVDGGVSVETFYFRAKSNGQCVISLEERRGWEQNVSPINTVQFGVLVN